MDLTFVVDRHGLLMRAVAGERLAQCRQRGRVFQPFGDAIRVPAARVPEGLRGPPLLASSFSGRASPFGRIAHSKETPTLLRLLREAAMADGNDDRKPADRTEVAGKAGDERETTEPLFEAMVGQGERTTSLSDGLVGISQATIEERVVRLEELDPAITEIVQMLQRRLDELEERVTALEAARDT